MNYYHNYFYDIWESWSSTIFLPGRSGVGSVRFPVNLISLDDPILNTWQCGIVAYFMEVPDPKLTFFSRLTKFQQFMFKRINWILTFLVGLIKIPHIRTLYVEIHCAIIEYENEKAKSAHYLVQLVDLDDQRQE